MGWCSVHCRIFSRIPGLSFRWVCACALSHVLLFTSPRTVARQASLSLEFSRQEYWSGLPFPSPGDLPVPGIKSVSFASPALQVDSLPLTPPGKPLIHRC